MVTLYIIISKRKPAYVEIKNDQCVGEQEGDHDSLRRSMISVAESARSIHSIANGISIERSRPAGMNSLIACNSYKSQAWSRKQAAGINMYSYSYGTLDTRSRNGVKNGNHNLM